MEGDPSPGVPGVPGVPDVPEFPGGVKGRERVKKKKEYLGGTCRDTLLAPPSTSAEYQLVKQGDHTQTLVHTFFLSSFLFLAVSGTTGPLDHSSTRVGQPFEGECKDARMGGGRE